MPDAMQKTRWSHALIAALTGVSTFFVYALLILALVIQGVLSSQYEKLNTLISEAEKIGSEGVAIISRLNALDVDECTDELLSAMRKELFLASRIRDIGFIEGDFLICSTGQGVLETPLKQAPWGFISARGIKHWPSAHLVLFDGEVTAAIAQKGQFNVVYDTRWLEQQATVSTRWELVYRKSRSKFIHTYGDKELFRNLNDKSAQVVNLTSTYSEACSKSIPYCAGTETTHTDIINRSQDFAAYALLIGIALGLGAGFLVGSALKKRRNTENRIIRGVKHNAYFPLFQPVVDLQSGKIIGCEVLARFQDAYGAIYPDEFIPVLARAKLSWPFTQQIMQKTLENLDPRADLPDGFKVNINLFPSDIAQNRVQGANISLALAASRFHIAFEITEDEQLDTATARVCIEWIKQQNFELAVDDFGTGYSNLSKVRDLGCNTLKIDRSFVLDIDSGGLGAALVPLMIRIANELGMEVVAEGVETAAHAAIVREMGARFAQGWAFGKPMLAGKLEELVRTTSRTGLRT